MDSPKIPQERDTIFWQSLNIKKGMLSSVSLSVYFEKHKILEIITEIIFEICRDRPANVVKWLSDNFRRIANEFVCSRTFLLFPNRFDLHKFSEFYQKKYNIPTILYKKKSSQSTEDILHTLELFLKKHNLTEKNKIFINFPDSCDQIKNFYEHSIKPTNVFEIKSDSRPDQTCCLLEDFVKKENYESITNYYKDKYKVIHYGSRDTATNRLQDVEEIALKLANLMEYSNIPDDRLLKSDYRYRIILYGSRGSGQKTHAISIAKRFNLVPIFAAQVIASYLGETTGIGTALRNRLVGHNELSILSEAAAIQTRLLQNDCIQHGWVLVDYPYNKEGFKICTEDKIMPPNRIVILHCRKKLALRRLQKSWDQKYKNNNTNMIPKNYMKFVEAEMSYISLHKNDIYNFLSKSDIPVIHIDGNHSFKTVEKELWGKIEQYHGKIATDNTGAEACCTNEII